ncbi:hypothetical protein Trydic_g5878 [Trypoxylus dichotomus]
MRPKRTHDTVASAAVLDASSNEGTSTADDHISSFQDAVSACHHFDVRVGHLKEGAWRKALAAVWVTLSQDSAEELMCIQGVGGESGGSFWSTYAGLQVITVVITGDATEATRIAKIPLVERRERPNSISLIVYAFTEGPFKLAAIKTTESKERRRR